MKKSNKVLIIVALIVLNIMVLFVLGQSLLGGTSEYDRTLAEARSYAEQELCSKSIDKYYDLLIISDSLDVRMEMIDVYAKGIENGEFENDYDACYEVEEMLDKYPKEIEAYEKACSFLLNYEKYEECAELLMQARDVKVNSDKIEEYRKKVRYQYERRYSMYETVLPCSSGYYTVSAEENFSFLDNEGSPCSKGDYTYLSSFSEGYAFAKTLLPDGSEKSFIIDGDEQRQIYLDSVEESSGVGLGKDNENNKLLLISCKVGEKYKYYGMDGKVVFGDYKFAGRFRNNVAAVMEAEGKWKLIDATGKAIVDTVFKDVVLNEFDECAPKGVIIADDGSGYHLYNHKGEKIGDFSCDEAKAYVDSYFAFRKGDKWGFADSEGNVVIQPAYEDAKSFSNKMGAVKKGNNWCFINPENEIVIEEIFEDVDYLNDNGICFVKIDGYWSNLEFYYTGE